MRVQPSSQQVHNATMLMNQVQNRITPRLAALEAHAEHLQDCLERGDSKDIDRAVELVQLQLHHVYSEVLITQGVAMGTRIIDA